ncbi:uncharacterized protein LOC110507674 isoform X4 [Oncorhynchus mykiss]|uniref:uncharacterized protein LOC110507674 isoform X4 n=1 Tax=Oncorhynchus mykiss TaxID=8022 RepID=UPI001877B33B|nr:uncharacterized protein LOC110507674 isoform X4 [Oncorhynchus mykiss]
MASLLMADRSVSTRRANLAVVAGPEADSEGALQVAEEVEEDTSVEAEVVVVEEVGVASHEVVETGDMVVDVTTTEVEAHTDQKEATTTKTEHKEEDMEIVQEVRTETATIAMVTRVAGRTVASGCLSSGHGPSPRTGGPISMTAGLAWS